MSQESMLIISGSILLMIALILLLVYIRRYIRQLAHSIEKIDSTLSVMMQMDEKNTKKIVSTIEKTVTNSIDDLQAKNIIIEKCDDEELYEKVRELFEDSDDLYTTSQLQKIFHVGYARLARVIDELNDDVIVQVKDDRIGSAVWGSINVYESTMGDEDGGVDMDDILKEKFVEALKDPLYKNVRKWALSTNKDITQDDLQREFSIGYAHTSRLYDLLVLDGIVQKKIMKK